MIVFRRFFLNIVFIYILLVTGCNSAYVTEESTKASQLTNTPNKFPSPTPLDTPVPKPTYAPIPALAYNLQDELYGLLENNGNCELPCFLGITPGNTIWAEAKMFLEKYSVNRPIKYDESRATLTNKQYTTSIQTNKDIHLLINLALDVNEKDIVTHIAFDVSIYDGSSLAFDDHHLSRYSLREVFQRYGPPTSVYFLPPERGNYGIQVVYENLKMVIDLTGQAKKIDTGGYEICPNLGNGNIPTMEIALASPTDPIDVKTLIGYPFWEGKPQFEEASDMSLNDFYQLIIGNQQPACFPIN